MAKTETRPPEEYEMHTYRLGPIEEMITSQLGNFSVFAYDDMLGAMWSKSTNCVMFSAFVEVQRVVEFLRRVCTVLRVTVFLTKFGNQDMTGAERRILETNGFFLASKEGWYWKSCDEGK